MVVIILGFIFFHCMIVIYEGKRKDL